MNYFRLMFPFIYILIMFIGVTLTQEDDDDSMSFIGLAYEAYNPCPDGFISMGREIGRKPSEENYWEGSFNLNNFTHLNEARLEITLDNSAVVTVVLTQMIKFFFLISFIRYKFIAGSKYCSNRISGYNIQNNTI